MLARQVAPFADAERQRVIARRALDQEAEGGVGEAGAFVAHDGVGDLMIATRDQHVGHRLAQRFALRDRGEVLLAFALGVGNEIGLVEPIRVEQHRPRDLDVVVEGERPHHARRRVGHIGKPV